MTWPPACENVSPEAEELTVLEELAEQNIEARDRECQSLCDGGVCSEVTSFETLR